MKRLFLFFFISFFSLSCQKENEDLQKYSGVWEASDKANPPFRFKVLLFLSEGKLLGRFESDRIGNVSLRNIITANGEVTFDAVLGTSFFVGGKLGLIETDSAQGYLKINDHQFEVYGSRVSMTVSDEVIETSPQWSNVVSQLLFTAEKFGNKDIILAEPGKKYRNITQDPAIDEGAIWSPMGDQIAFFSDRTGYKEVYLIRPDGSGLRQLTNGIDRPDLLDWSFDAKKLLFSTSKGPYIIDLQSGNYRKYADNQPSAYYARFAPDSYDIALTTTTNNKYNIAMIDFESGKLHLLDDSPTPDFNQRWSPDGQKLVWISTRDGNSEVYTMNRDGSGTARLTNNSGRDNNPNWSANGDKILWVSRMDGNPEIYIMNVDGSGVTNLTQSEASDLDPVWGKDDQTVIFTSDRNGSRKIYQLSLIDYSVKPYLE